MSTLIGAVTTDVGVVRDHNEDNHLMDLSGQVFIVADGMGGHAAGEVASEMAVRLSHQSWSTEATRRRIDAYTERGDAETRRDLIRAVGEAVMQAHLEIVKASQDDESRGGMGTTFTGFLVAGGDAIFAHAGDSRGYLLRDEIAIQLSEDHTLLARLRASGIDPVAEGGDINRFKGVLTNGLGIGGANHVDTFVLPLCSGDKLMLCSDGVYEYFTEAEIGEVLTKAASPALAAQRLVQLALDRGGADNATAMVVKVVEAGETKVPVEQRQADARATEACPLLAELSTQERLRALRIAIARDVDAGAVLPPIAMGERVAYIVLDGTALVEGQSVGAGALVYPHALVGGTPMPDRSEQAKATSALRLLTIRRDDFFEITEDDSDLGVKMYAALTQLIAR